MHYDFLIVGGGIGGAVLAAKLGRQGKKVLVLEKSLGPQRGIRPEIVWPATTSVFFSLLPKELLECKILLRLGAIVVRDTGGMSLTLSHDLFGRAGIERWSANPIELQDQLLGLDCFELRRGMEVTRLLHQKDNVVGVRCRNAATSREQEFLARYTVGNDGVHSLVRNQCGLEMTTRMFPVDFLCFGFSWPPEFETAVTRVWLNTTGLASGILAMFALPLAGRQGAGLIVVRPEVFDNPDQTKAAWKKFSSFDDAIQQVIGERQFPSGFVRVRRRWGHAAHYGRLGALLMGDGAHPVSPVGGQGTNMAVADACTLAELAASNHPDLAGQYERRRRPANARSLRFTRIADRLLRLPGWCFPAFALDRGLRWAVQHPSLLTRLIRYASTAFQERNR